MSTWVVLVIDWWPQIKVLHRKLFSHYPSSGNSLFRVTLCPFVKTSGLLKAFFLMCCMFYETNRFTNYTFTQLQIQHETPLSGVQTGPRALVQKSQTGEFPVGIDGVSKCCSRLQNGWNLPNPMFFCFFLGGGGVLYVKTYLAKVPQCLGYSMQNCLFQTFLGPPYTMSKKGPE